VKLPFDISDQVKKGDLLVELDPVDELRARLMQSKVNLQTAEKDLAAEQKSAEAALKPAKARAKNVRAKAERMKQLLKKKLASEENKDTADTAAIQAEVDLENALIRLEELTIKEQELEIKRQDIKLAEAQMETNRIDLFLLSMEWFPNATCNQGKSFLRESAMSVEALGLWFFLISHAFLFSLRLTRVISGKWSWGRR